MACIAATLWLTGCGSKLEKQTLKTVEPLIAQKDYSQALSTLQDAIEQEPDNRALKRKRVEICLLADKPQLAFPAYRALLMKPRKKDKDGNLPAPEYDESDSVVIDHLKHADPKVRATAAKVLSSIKDPKSVSALVAVLDDKDTDVRRAAANALGQIRDEKAVDGLIKCLSDSSWFVRGEAAQALGEIKNPKAAVGLFKLLEDPDNYVRENAARALSGLAADSNKEIYRQHMQSANEYIKMTATLGLVALKDPAVEPILMGFLDHPNPMIQLNGIKALATLKSASALPVIRKIAQEDKNVQKRCTAILALGVYMDKESLPMLKSTVENTSNSDEVRSASYIAYRQIATGGSEQ